MVFYQEVVSQIVTVLFFSTSFPTKVPMQVLVVMVLRVQ